MRNLILIATVPVIVASCGSPRTAVYYPPAPGPTAYDVGYFYDYLSPYGRWVFLPGYGYVWSPSDVGYGWRPYTNGHWVLTDYGWTWASGYNWGWAPFHYGRWAYSGGGWYWVPGTVWGPAWVSWRSGPGYCGWAPLPPSAVWRPGYGLERFNEREIDERSYVFVQQRNLTAVNLNQHIEAGARNSALLRGTQNVTSYTTEGGRIVNRGISVDRFEKETGQVVPRRTLVDSAGAGTGGARISGNQVEMYRPKLSDAKPKNLPPGIQSGTRADSSTESNRKQEKAQRNAANQQQLDQQNQAKQQRKAQRQLDQQKQAEQQRKVEAQRQLDQQNQAKQQRKVQAQQEQDRMIRENKQRKADQQAQDQSRKQQKLERKQQKQNQSTPSKKDKAKNPSIETGS